MNLFVTAIDTDSGKTVVSSILCEALHADYWKPVQAGFPRDAAVVKDLISNKTSRIHEEAYLLSMAASPHQAASAQGIKIDIAKFTPPETNNHLIIEGAGGCLVPLNDEHFVVDLITKLDAEVVVVADLYLGSINHTLLTFEALKARKLRVKGVVFNGDANTESMRIILHHTGVTQLLHLKKEPTMDRRVVARYAEAIKPGLL